MTAVRTRRTVTFAELRDGDSLVDLNETIWRVSEVSHDAEDVAFVITHPVDKKMKPRRVTQPHSKAATISRIWEDEAAPSDDAVHDAAVDAARELPATVETVVTTEEQDSLDAATKDQPAVVPMLFEDMTDLERRSHMYAAHGIWPADWMSRAELIKDHAETHAAQEAGRVNAKFKPHVHVKPEESK